MTKSQISKQRRAERDEVFQFLMDNVRDASGERPLPTRAVWIVYLVWRTSRGLPKSAFSIKGFGKVLPYKRVVVWDRKEGCSTHAIPGKRLA